MKRLKILITTSYYWPELAGSAPYVTGLAEYLGAKNHDVVVATTFAHYPRWRSTANGRPMSAETRESVRVKRRWTYVPRRQSAAHRALYESTLYTGGLTALPMRPRPDVVIGTCPSLAGAALAASAAALYRVPYGLIFQDLMGRAADQSGVAGGGLVAAAVRRAELALARGATRIAIVAEGFRSYFVEGGVDPERVDRVRNWTRRVEPRETVAETRRRLGWRPDVFICLHAGNMGRKQALDNLLATAGLLRDQGVRIVLAGEGNDRPRLQARSRELGLDNVDFVEPQAPGKWEEMMQAADVLLVNQRAAVADMSLPSKLTSYFAAGRPVVAAASAESETARELGSAGAGLVVPPQEPSALRDAILSLRRDPAVAAAMSESARRFTATHLSAEVSLAAHEEFVARVAAPASGRRRRVRGLPA